MRRKRKIYNTYHDLKYTFKNCKMDVLCDEEIYTKDEILKIQEIVKACSKEIVIDKSYVNREDSKYNNTFILETGWKELCGLVLSTKFADLCTPEESMIILESYKLLIIQYLYHILQLFGFDTEFVMIDMKDRSKFMSIVEIDDSNYVLKYPGKWQLW